MNAALVYIENNSLKEVISFRHDSELKYITYALYQARLRIYVGPQMLTDLESWKI